jgi:hypothetical protein
MKTIFFLALVLLSSKVMAYADCPQSGNWLKDSFCELTGGVLVISKYEKPLSGDILNNPFQQCKEPWPSKWCEDNQKENNVWQ